MIKCQCPMCKEFFEAEQEWIGQPAQCPNCNNLITITAAIVTPIAVPQPRLQPQPAQPPQMPVMQVSVKTKSAEKLVSLLDLYFRIVGILLVIPLVFLVIACIYCFVNENSIAGGTFLGQAIMLPVVIFAIYVVCEVVKFFVVKIDEITQNTKK